MKAYVRLTHGSMSSLYPLSFLSITVTKTYFIVGPKKKDLPNEDPSPTITAADGSSEEVIGPEHTVRHWTRSSSCQSLAVIADSGDVAAVSWLYHGCVLSPPGYRTLAPVLLSPSVYFPRVPWSLEMDRSR